MSKRRQSKRTRANEKVKVFFAKGNPSVKIPSKIEENMGFDVYANFQDEYMIILPHETKMIPTGLYSAVSAEYALVLKERGSTGTKGMGQRCGVIDSGYRGEWFVPITNLNEKPIIITKETNPTTLEILAEDYIVYPYTKAITQAVLLPVPKVKVCEISLEELMTIESVRGNGKLGSSNK